MKYALAIALGASVWAAEPTALVIGRVVELKGTWIDRAYDKAVGPNYQVQTKSLLERKVPLRDADLLEIKSTGGVVITFRCNHDMTCVGPLSLCRIPKSGATSFALVNRFIDFVKREECLGTDYSNMRAFIHRGEADSRSGVFLLRQGKLTPEELFGGSVPAGIKEVEFCRVRPGGVCPEKVSSVAVQAAVRRSSWRQDSTRRW